MKLFINQLLTACPPDAQATTKHTVQYATGSSGRWPYLTDGVSRYASLSGTSGGDHGQRLMLLVSVARAKNAAAEAAIADRREEGEEEEERVAVVREVEGAESPARRANASARVKASGG